MVIKFLNLLAAMYERIEDKQKGATATEYALLVALIAIVIAVAVGLFGTDLSKFFGRIATTVSNWAK